MYQPECNLVYQYDASGAIIGFTYYPYSGTATQYFFGKNAQGDVICIYDATGNTVARYNYDAWGACTIAYDNTSIGIANINPIRYRSYYYDAETGWYYLQSRYYDPAVGRFISPDDPSLLGANGDLLSYNLYAYCSNNPVNYSDPSGHFLVSTAIAVGFWVGLSIGLVGGAVAGGAIAYNVAKNNGCEGWQLFSWTLAGVVGGGVLGGAAGAVLGSSIGYGVGLIWGSAPAAGSSGAVALWSGGKGIAAKAAMNFAKTTGANVVSKTFAGKTLSFASHFLPKSISNYLWGYLSAEFVAGASYATVFLYEHGIDFGSVFNMYEIWTLMEYGIERVIHFVM